MELVVLVGNIGTGKTSYKKEHYEWVKNTRILCTDEWEQQTVEEREERFYKELEKGLNNDERVVIDGPNMQRAVRNRWLFFKSKAEKELGKPGKAIILDFGPGNTMTLQRRIEESPETPPKRWEQEHQENLEEYEEPKETENYDEIKQFWK